MEFGGSGEDSARNFVRTFLWQEMAVIRQRLHFDMFGDQIERQSQRRAFRDRAGNASVAADNARSCSDRVRDASQSALCGHPG